ncbi:hypothetical protein C8Q74DRAFT_1365055 [Fomes fomentarius]|nr:hypothetical protein C8Q74DRAFT_1365055 [Fomes fomentarius]
MYQIADELDLVSGKRYVSAAICASADHAVASGGTTLVQALEQLASAWAAYLLWPFYAQGSKTRFDRIKDLLYTPPAESIEEEQAREQHRHWKQQVAERDNHFCFMSGRYDYYAVHCIPSVPKDVGCLESDAVWIVDREVFARNVHGNVDQDITLDMLKRYCAVDDTICGKMQGPQSTLYVNRASQNCLQIVPNRYEIKNYMPPNYCDSQHVTSHVTFVDHTGSGIDLPDGDLLKVHAALTGVLHRSAAIEAFTTLIDYDGYDTPPPPTGSGFWKSVVEYDGLETCLDVELCIATEAFDDLMCS